MNAKDFIDNLKTVKWFSNSGKINPKWKMFDTRDAAKVAAKGAAKDALWTAALDAVLDAARNALWTAALDAGGDAAKDALWKAERDAVWTAAGVAARKAALDARKAALDAGKAALDAGDASGDAARIANCLGVADLIDKKHIDFCDEVAEIWSAGYGRYATIDSVHYVYTRPGGQINEL